MTRILLALPLAAAIGCTATASDPVTSVDTGVLPPTKDAGTASRDAGEAPRDAGTNVDCRAEGPVVVTVQTDDGQQLEGDLYTTGTPGAPGAVLLHMIPPSNTRANYPAAFITSLVAKGINVLNLDRRGAGGDAALARTAYTGPNGKFDPKAAIDFLVAHDCAIDANRVAIVGASNGSTSALDYAVFAAADTSAVRPKTMVFLTGGTYTEMQNRIADHRTTLDAIPIAYVYSTQERAWSAAFEAGAPSDWRFMEYNPGAHGTRMLTTAAASIEEVTAFIQSNL